MDFIERWLGISPDGGDGSVELMLVIAALVAVICILIALVPRLRSLVFQVVGMCRRTSRRAGPGRLVAGDPRLS